MLLRHCISNGDRQVFHGDMIIVIQEVFHVYLNKFENAVTHLFLVRLGNN